MKRFFVLSGGILSLVLSFPAFPRVQLKDLRWKTLSANRTVHDWSGFYAGLNAGLVQHTMNITDNQASSFNATLRQEANSRPTAGFQLGYRIQLDPSAPSGVFGLEFAANFSNASFSKDYGSSFATYQLQANQVLKNLCLLEVTGGIAANRTLLFVAAGLSWVNITGSVTSEGGTPFFNSFSVAQRSIGTAMGGGVEYAISDKTSVRLKVDVIRPETWTSSDGTGDSFQISNNIVQGTVGINYRFG